MPQILASIDDINANLPSDDTLPTVVADEDNTGLLQISVARVVRGYLSRVIDNITIQSWLNPETTPEIIREIAGKLIASSLFFNQESKTSLEITKDSFAQKRYDEAIALLNQIITGEIIIDGVTTSGTSDMSDLDYFPVDDTDRAFTRGQPF